ncbi:MAG: NAD(P)-dependent oxidoreductase, partial [Rhodospirillaceae bacterium]
MTGRDAVGIVGLGVLGSAVAEVLLRNGFPVTGVDTDPDKIAALADAGLAAGTTPAALLADCAVVITCLPSVAALDAVVNGPDGLAAGGPSQAVVLEISTLPIDDKVAARDALAAAGVAMMDCPVSGNRIMALNGELTAFASGTEAEFDAAKSALEGFCRAAHFVGPFGDGMKMKICGNILNLVHNSVAAEVMILGMKSGLDPKVIHRVISGSGSSSRMFDVRGGLMATGDYGKEGMNFSIPIKDARIITDHAAKMLCPTPIYQAALQPYFAAVAQGYGDLDASAVLK